MTIFNLTFDVLDLLSANVPIIVKWKCEESYLVEINHVIIIHSSYFYIRGSMLKKKYSKLMVAFHFSFGSLRKNVMYDICTNIPQV